jgi:RNA polymerase sigma-70 factor (ECF subfamily)
VETVMRQDRGRLVGALIARLRDFQLAEDVLQEAAVSAITHWGRSGLPSSPQGWLLKVALRKAIDRLRGQTRSSRNAEAMAILAEDEAAEPEEAGVIPDDRLRLIFTCCHPALEPKTRVALTLRTVCGLTTTEVAQAFLDAEPAMGQRLCRAKAKIAAAGIPYAVPGPEDWDARLDAVLTVVYLIFTTGYTQGGGVSLYDEALFLGRLIDTLRPGEAEVEGALALMLLMRARAAARAPQGVTVPPARQDRGLWDHAMIAEGQGHLARAVARGRPGPFQIKAAIAALHAGTPPTDWAQVAALYGALYRHEPTPVVALNAAVARAEAGHAVEALALVEALAPQLGDFQPLHAVRADLLARLGRRAESLGAYERAIALASPPDARFLAEARARLLN